jgi:hypothetical protein
MVTSDSKFRKFPVRETRKGVQDAINGLKENASEDVKNFIVDVVQPYLGGRGSFILHLHNLDIEDKHSLLIAHRQYTLIRGIMVVDEGNEEFCVDDWLIVPPHTASHPLPENRHFKVTNNGHARTHVTFGEGMPLQGRNVLPALHDLAKMVSSLVDCFDTIRRANMR